MGLALGDLGDEYRELGYAGDCALSWASLAAAGDVYVAIHFLSWLLAGVVVRRVAPLVALGVGFEALEWAFKGVLPNFQECWCVGTRGVSRTGMGILERANQVAPLHLALCGVCRGARLCVCRSARVSARMSVGLGVSVGWVGLGLGVHVCIGI